MESGPHVDRRKHSRCPLSASVNFLHAPSGRPFPGRCVDVSRGGLLMYVPAGTPIQAGHSVRLTLTNIRNEKFADLADRPMPAEVIHVDHQAIVTMGHIAVGVRFVEA